MAPRHTPNSQRANGPTGPWHRLALARITGPDPPAPTGPRAPGSVCPAATRAWAPRLSGTQYQMRPRARTRRPSDIECQMRPRADRLHGAPTHTQLPTDQRANGPTELGTASHSRAPMARLRARGPTCQPANGPWHGLALYCILGPHPPTVTGQSANGPAGLGTSSHSRASLRPLWAKVPTGQSANGPPAPGARECHTVLPLTWPSQPVARARRPRSGQGVSQEKTLAGQRASEKGSPIFSKFLYMNPMKLSHHLT
jgi:hypothetical protein